MGRSYTATRGGARHQQLNTDDDEQVPYHNVCPDEALVNTTAPRLTLEPQSGVVLTSIRNFMATRRTLDMLRVKRRRDSPRVLLENLPLW